MFIQIQHFRIIKLLVLIVLLITSLHYFGCSLYTNKDFIPVEAKRPTTMFEQYALQIHEYKDVSFFVIPLALASDNIYIDVDFITPVADTTSLQTVPIFVIDSICFEGTCMDSSICRIPMTGFEALRLPYPNNIVHVVPDKDLRYQEGQLMPLGFALEKVLWLPGKYSNKNVFVTFYARLLDRATGKTIAEESKKVEYFIKKKTTLNAGG